MAALYVKACTGLLIVFFLSGIHLISSQQADLFITTPKKMEALSGSCVQIPCNFSAREDVMFNGTGDPIGVWLKNEHPFDGRQGNVIFNGSLTDNLYQGEIPGDLRQKNCTTIFYNLTTDHADRYFFRVESSQFRATAINDPFVITITDSPPTPITNNTISTPQQKEGDVATFTCSAIAPCPAYPPVLQWSPPWDAGTQTQLEVNSADRTVTARSQMTLTLAEEHDGVNVSCSVSYPVNGTESNFKTTNKMLLRLDVTYSPKRTSASISPTDGLVSVGSWVNFTCTSTAKPPVHSFIWFKTSNDGPTTNVSAGDFYSFNVSSADDGGAYHCEATNKIGSQNSSEILLRVKPVTRPDDDMLSSQAIIGGITGITLVICLVVFIIWWLHSRRSAVPQTQSQLVGEPANQNADEEIHYGEIDFSKMQPGSLRVKQPEPDTEYAEVNAGRLAPASSSVTANEPNDDLYSQVKH